MLSKSDIVNTEKRYKQMMQGTVETQIPTPDQHWDNILKVVNIWLNVKILPQFISIVDIEDMIMLTRYYYGDYCACRWCDILIRLEKYGWRDSEISKIINYVPRFMNGSLKSSLRLSDMYIPGLMYDIYFLHDHSCQQIFYRLGKQGTKIALIR
jgi:hypothetical protein